MTTLKYKTLPEKIKKCIYFMPIISGQLIIIGLICISFKFKSTNELPYNRMGTYHGQLEFEGTKNQYKMMMKLDIAPMEKGYHFNISYIDSMGKIDIRNYKLIPDQTKNEFILDENNSIKLNMTKFGNNLISHYRVDDHLIAVSYTFSDTGCLFEVYTSSFSKQLSTGGQNGVPKVVSYPVGYGQKALLKKSGL